MTFINVFHFDFLIQKKIKQIVNVVVAVFLCHQTKSPLPSSGFLKNLGEHILMELMGIYKYWKTFLAIQKTRAGKDEHIFKNHPIVKIRMEGKTTFFSLIRGFIYKYSFIISSFLSSLFNSLLSFPSRFFCPETIFSNLFVASGEYLPMPIAINAASFA